MKDFSKYIILIFAFTTSACQPPPDHYKIHILYPNVMGLEIKAPVSCNGLTIGEVENIQLFKREVLVTCAIDTTKGKILTNSRLILSQADLMSDKFIEVKMDTTSLAYLANEDTLQGEIEAPKALHFDVDSTMMKNLKPLLDSLAKVMEKVTKEYDKRVK